MKKFSMRKNSILKSLGLILISVFLLVFVYPQGYSNVTGAEAPKVKPFSLGLDLQGGTHLVYEADMSQVPSGQRADAMEGVRDVIERRVNAFGVAEPLVQINKTGDSWRLIVELAGVKDVNRAINLIGQTPLLEFKEVNNDQERELTEEQQKSLDEFNKNARIKAQSYLSRVLSNGSEFDVIKEELNSDQQNITINDDGQAELNFANILEKDVLVEKLDNITATGQYAELYTVLADQPTGVYINELFETTEGLSAVKINSRDSNGKEVKARHLLVCYNKDTGCPVDRTKEEAEKLINDLKAQATIDNFTALIAENSDEPGAAERNGDLGWFGVGQMVKPFEQASFDQEVGTISDVVTTQFGYHLIHKLEERPVDEISVNRVLVKTKNADDILPPREYFKNTELSGKHLDRAVVDFDQTTGQPMINLNFNEEGKELFAAITKRNIGKPLAIFLDGQSIIDTTGDGVIDGNDIYAPQISDEIKEGRAQITGSSDLQTVKKITKRLNSGALPVPIKLINQQTVGATLGAESVAQSLKAGMWGIILVMIFMLLYYRLPGVTAVLSLGVYALLVLSSFKLLSITLTLSGIAGFILSIGMAVDANVLIFERIKEELKVGKTLHAAIKDGFRRAWTSIRDGNVSTLITCGILLTFGTGMIKGFAVTLGIGVVLSMFSAILVTKVFLHALTPSSLRDSSRWMFLGAKKK